jgi:hypothetical protein
LAAIDPGDDRVDQREALAGAAPWRLGGEEQIEDPLLGSGRHPSAPGPPDGESCVSCARFR